MRVSDQSNASGLDEVMAERLSEQMTAPELRSWCRRHGVVRERGDSKMETARRAVRQNPVAVSKRVLPEYSNTGEEPGARGRA